MKIGGINHYDQRLSRICIHSLHFNHFCLWHIPLYYANFQRLFKGNISEAIIFPKVLTAGEQSLLETNQNAFYFSGSVSISSSASGAICPGTNVTFTSDISNFTNTPSFQWYKNNVILSGETSATYSTTALNNNDVIKVIAGGATSNELIATTTAGPSVSVLGDGCINKTTLTTPTGATAYSWYKDNVAISNTNFDYKRLAIDYSSSFDLLLPLVGNYFFFEIRKYKQMNNICLLLSFVSFLVLKFYCFFLVDKI